MVFNVHKPDLFANLRNIRRNGLAFSQIIAEDAAHIYQRDRIESFDDSVTSQDFSFIISVVISEKVLVSRSLKDSTGDGG